MRRKTCNRFYLYTSQENGKKYFHNAVTNQVVWAPPEDSTIVDPDTNQIVQIDMKEFERMEVSTTFVLSSPVPDKKPRKTLHVSPHSRVSPALSRFSLSATMTVLSGVKKEIVSRMSLFPIYLPQDISKDKEEYDIRAFAVSNFNTRTRGSFFSKKQIPPDELLVYDTDTSILPILKQTSPQANKKCCEIFMLVLDYCKQEPKAQPYALVQILNKSHDLIDETYVILLKLIHNNPSLDNTQRVWDLILTVCTFYPPSKYLQPLVRHVVAVEALGTKANINAIAKIAYIRLAARCDCDEIGTMQPMNWVNLIPTHPVQDTFIFGAPLLELIYAQRRSAPKCTIPLFLHRFTHELFAAGAHKMEGTFRLPGNKVQIDLMVEEIHNGKEVFKDADLRDLASLFKRWLAELPEPIVPMCMYNTLVEALQKKEIMKFVETLPKVNHDTLGYLVGFLQEFVKSQDVTKMGIIPVSMIFGANVVRIVSCDPMTMKQMTENGKNFMAYLIPNWDVSFIYPLPLEFLPG